MSLVLPTPFRGRDLDLPICPPHSLAFNLSTFFGPYRKEGRRTYKKLSAFGGSVRPFVCYQNTVKVRIYIQEREQNKIKSRKTIETYFPLEKNENTISKNLQKRRKKVNQINWTPGLYQHPRLYLHPHLHTYLHQQHSLGIKVLLYLIMHSI